MDFLLPDDDTMDIMRREFDRMKRGARASALSFSDGEADSSAGNRDLGAYISTVFFLLYFVRRLRYNTSYGIQIFDADRSLEQIRSVGNNFGQLNDLG